MLGVSTRPKSASVFFFEFPQHSPHELPTNDFHQLAINTPPRYQKVAGSTCSIMKRTPTLRNGFPGHGKKPHLPRTGQQGNGTEDQKIDKQQ